MNVTIVKVTKPDALYCRYPGQHEAQPAVLELNLETGELRCDYNAAIGSGLPGSVYNGQTRWIGIPPLTADAANQLMADVAPLAQRVLDDSEIEWDGNGYVGRLGKDANAALDEIGAACAEERFDSSVMVIEYDASDFLGNEVRQETIDRLGITADTTDEQLDAMAEAEERDATALNSNDGYTVLNGTVDWLRGVRDEMREAARDELIEAGERRAALTEQLDQANAVIDANIARFAAWGYDSRAIGRYIGVSHTTVQNRLARIRQQQAEEPTYHADAAWDTDRLGVYADETGQKVAEGQLEWVDPDDDSSAADDQRRAAITAALAALGWEPVPHAEWLHVDGGPGCEAGAERVPVRQR